INCNGVNHCTKYANTVYQTNVTFPGKKTWYGLVTLLPNNILFEDDSLGDTNTIAELGLQITVGTHSGHYSCPTATTIAAVDFGYAYKNPKEPVLKSGALAVHNFYLYLTKDGQSCTGKFVFAMYPPGSNPFSNNLKPLLKSGVAKLTCERLKPKGLTLF
ncbi:unnamed protein product, partial [Didymodactylos carnosus]